MGYILKTEQLLFFSKIWKHGRYFEILNYQYVDEEKIKIPMIFFREQILLKKNHNRPKR